MPRRPHDPTPPLLPAIPAFAALQPFVDIRQGSPHPLAWRGGDYLDELRATYRRDRGIFALVRESGVVVMGCRETLPVLAGVFRALGWEVDDGQQDREDAWKGTS